MTAAPLLILHPFGDTAGGAPWRDAFESATWSGPVFAPDLPGHGGAPAPSDGNYEVADPAIWALRVLHEHPECDRPVVVGAGKSGWSALMLALAGRSRALVLAGALEGPWLDAVPWAQAQREWLRAIAADPAAAGPPPPGASDPRLAHGVPDIADGSLVVRALARVAVPVLRIDTADPAAVAPAVAAWVRDALDADDADDAVDAVDADDAGGGGSRLGSEAARG